MPADAGTAPGAASGPVFAATAQLRAGVIRCFSTFDFFLTGGGVLAANTGFTSFPEAPESTKPGAMSM